MDDYKDIINNLLRHYSDEYWAGQAADAMEHLINEYKYLGEFNDAICKEYRNVKKERDAALADLKEESYCMTCKHLTSAKEEKPCSHCSSLIGGGENNWEWRGVQEMEYETD